LPQSSPKADIEGKATISEPSRKQLKRKGRSQVAVDSRHGKDCADPTDTAFLKQASESFADWNTKEAAEDFRDF
jgi:hypothetical protein